MKNSIFLFFLIIITVGCTNAKNKQAKTVLEPGVYYLDSKRSRDTLFFQTTKPISLIRNWNLTTWEIDEDSIFQKDHKSFAEHFGKDKCSYSLQNDTLIITYRNRIEELKHPSSKAIYSFDKYLVLLSGNGFLHLLKIEDEKKVNSDIRSDIQLR